MVRYAVEKDSLFLADPRSLMEGNFLEAKARWLRSQNDKKKDKRNGWQN